MSFFAKSNDLKVVESQAESAPGATGKTVRHSNWPKSLRWHLTTADTLSRLTITPAMAEEMLSYNTSNRPVSCPRVRVYAERMADGIWEYNKAEPITFDDAGAIQEGQHRLLACVESGASFDADVAFGSPAKAFPVVGCSGTRTAADVFAINGVPNHAMAAATTRFLMKYDAEKVPGDGGRGFYPTLREVYDAYCGYPDLQTSIKVGMSFGRDRLPKPSIAAAIHYLCAQKSRRAADEYFKKIHEGVGFTSKRDPAYKVRDFLVRNDGKRLTGIEVAGSLVQGWNAIRTRKPLARINTDKIGRVI